MTWNCQTKGLSHLFSLCSDRAKLIFLFDYQRTVHTNDYAAIETISKSVMKDKQPFQRLVATKEDLLKMFRVCFFKMIDDNITSELIA